jgi:hypothetical protein
LYKTDADRSVVKQAARRAKAEWQAKNAEKAKYARIALKEIGPSL